MKRELTFNICGKKFILPTTPDPLEFTWENELKEYLEPSRVTMKPNHKRYRMVKKKKK